MNFLLGSHAGSRIFFLHLCRRRSLARAREVLDEALQRLRPFVEHKIVRELTFLRRDLSVRPDMRWVYDRGVESCLDTMMQEYRVENAACIRCQTKAHV